MKTIECQSLKTEIKWGLITFAVGLPIFVTFFYLSVVQIIKLEFEYFFLVEGLTFFFAFVAPFIVAANRRDIFFTENTITLKEYHYLLRFLMPRRTVSLSWDDILAWDESLYVWDFKRRDPINIDLLFRDGDEKKVYRLPGCFMFIDKKRIRYSEFLQHIGPYLEKIPRNRKILRKYDKSQSITAYATLISGWVLIGCSTMGMLMASLGEDAPGMTVIAGFVGLFLLKISKQLFDDTKNTVKT